MRQIAVAALSETSLDCQSMNIGNYRMKARYLTIAMLLLAGLTAKVAAEPIRLACTMGHEPEPRLHLYLNEETQEVRSVETAEVLTFKNGPLPPSYWRQPGTMYVQFQAERIVFGYSGTGDGTKKPFSMHHILDRGSGQLLIGTLESNQFHGVLSFLCKKEERQF